MTNYVKRWNSDKGDYDLLPESVFPIYNRSTHSLEQRLTFKYVGTYQHEDEWNVIGEAEAHLLPIVHLDETDPCDPTTRSGFALVRLADGQTADVETMRDAIRATFTSSGCHHEHDCCGCRSHHARVKHVKGRIFRLTITSARNY